MERDETEETSGDRAEEFARRAAAKRNGLATEFWQFLRHNKKWWLLPLLLALGLVGLFVVLASTGAGPFIYTLF